MSIFGKSHFVSNGIYGSNVISVETDQRNYKDVVITCSNCIRVYEPNERTIIESWLFKSWMAPVSGCVTSSKGEFYCPVAANALLKWTANQKQLENMPQIKFGSSVTSLKAMSGAVYVVFEGGCIEEISHAIFHRKVKRPQLLPPSFTVQQLLLGENWVTAVATSTKEDGIKTSIFQYPQGCTDPAQVVEFLLARPSLSLTGVCLLSYCRAVTLWSNGELCVSAVCHEPGQDQSPHRPALTVRPVGRLGGLVDCGRPARLLRLYDWVVAVLGLDVSKDGGRIALWDVENHVEVARRNFKLYQPSLRCWAGGLGENGGAILLHEKQELTVVPLNRMPARGIAPYVLNQPPVSVACAGELALKTWVQPGKTEQDASPATTAGRASVTPNIDALIRKKDLETLDLSLCVATLVNEATERRSLALACEIIGCYKKSLPERCIVDLMTLLFAADCSDLASTALKYVDLASYGPASAPLSLKSFFERLGKNTQEPLGEYTANTPVREAPGKRKREKSSSGKKKAKRARMDGTLDNGHEELTNGGSPVSRLPNGHAPPTDQAPASEDDACPMFEGGWLLLHQLLCAPFTQEFMMKELRRLPFRNALSLVAYLGRLREYSPVLEFASAATDGVDGEQCDTHNGSRATLSPLKSRNMRRSSVLMKPSQWDDADALHAGADVPSGGTDQPEQKLLQVVLPTTDVVVQWHLMLYQAHEQAILLEMELQNAACLNDDDLKEEEADAADFLELAHTEELLSKEADEEAQAPVAVKTSLPDPLYSTEIITFPW